MTRARTRAVSGLAFWLAGIGLILAIMLAGAGVYLWLSSGTRDVVGGPFRLTDQFDQPVTQATFRGKYMLVYFGYTSCPDVCPTTLTTLSAALEKLGPKANGIAPVFITIDPARDTPAVLKDWLAAFSPRLVGLTGTQPQIDAVERQYHVYAEKHVAGPGSNDYLFDHSSFLYVMGPHGRFVEPIDAGESGPRMLADLEKLVTPGGPSGGV